VRVLDGDGQPVPDAMIELWQADAAGAYSTASSPPGSFAGFGRLGTNEDGVCVFETIRPGPVPGSDGTPEAAHINVCVFARGLLRHLYTRIYFEGDPALGHDPLLSVVVADRRATLLARPAADPATWTFLVRLQGDDETVFFDV
jgi:protocatechuate 3,4-dioxygenase alpha subunit